MSPFPIPAGVTDPAAPRVEIAASVTAIKPRTLKALIRLDLTMAEARKFVEDPTNSGLLPEWAVSNNRAKFSVRIRITDAPAGAKGRAYGRLSKHKKVADALIRQLEAMEKMCEEYRLALGWIYLDNDQSAWAGSQAARKRLGIALLNEELERGEYVVFWKLDRMYRDMGRGGKALSDWKEQGVGAYSVIDPLKGEIGLYQQLIGTIALMSAEAASNDTSARIKDKHDKIANNGRYTGRHDPLGHLTVDRGEDDTTAGLELIVDAPVAAALRYGVDRMMNHGEGWSALGKALAQVNKTAPDGSEYDPRYLKNLLCQPRLAGYRISGSRHDGMNPYGLPYKKRLELCVKKDGVLWQCFPHIFTFAEWVRIQEWLESRKGTKRERVHVREAVGFTYCTCGTAFKGSGVAGELKATYVCGEKGWKLNEAGERVQVCPSNIISERNLNNYLALLLMVNCTPELMALAAEAAQMLDAARNDAVANVDPQIAELEKARKKVMDHYDMAEGDDDAQERYKAEAKELSAKIGKLKKAAATAVQTSNAKPLWGPYRDLTEAWVKMSAAQRNAFMTWAFESVVIEHAPNTGAWFNPTRITVNWNEGVLAGPVVLPHWDGSKPMLDVDANGRLILSAPMQAYRAGNLDGASLTALHGLKVEEMNAALAQAPKARKDALAAKVDAIRDEILEELSRLTGTPVDTKSEENGAQGTSAALGDLSALLNVA